MSAFGLQTMDASGNIIFDSTTVVGGVVVDYRTVSAGASTFTYPAFGSYTAFLVTQDAKGTGVTLDTALGYPRVNVAAGDPGRRFILAVF